MIESAKSIFGPVAIAAVLACLAPGPTVRAKGVALNDAQVDNLVRRSYPYVAMYNVNNKGAMRYGGWNICGADTQLKDHTFKIIARPNNDTLYITCLLDLRKDPVILDMPAFDSEYVSLMATGYDHYVNIPMSTRQGEDGGIAIYIAAKKPAGVPEENWLPLNRGDYGIDVVLRLYVPDMEKFKTWTPPKAEQLATT